MNVRVTVDGLFLDPRLLWYPHMSLSSARPRVPPSSYEVVVARSEFISVLAERYTACVEELKRDDALTGETDFFGEAGYPDFSQLLEHPALCGEVMGAYFFGELFEHFLPWGNPGAGSFVIETITHVYGGAATISISGQCLRV